MAIILGIDLGTQSLKAMLLDDERGVLNVQSAEYELYFPQIGWAEEEPESWWSALKCALRKMKRACPAEFDAVCAVGLSGQMHGMVPLDRVGKPAARAMIWVDQRSKKQVEAIESSYSPRELAKTMHNHVFTGFGFPSLLWIKEERPQVFAQIRKICSPKDYLRLRLVGGEPETDMSDASSMTGFDFARRCWNGEVLKKFGLDAEIFPVSRESTEIAGTVTAQAARETGIAEGTKVVYGSGDAAALAMGCGMVREGIAVSNIGTGANFSCYSSKDAYDPQLRMQEFCNAVNRSYLLSGAILSGGLSMSWLKKNVVGIDDYTTINRLANSVPAGSDGLIFLPYLGGERTPHMDFNACGNFFGLRHIHHQGHFCRAVMEGVAFALKDAQNVMQENKIAVQTIIAAGGGSKSPLWLQIQADVFEREVAVSDSEEEACLGACLLAGVGVGLFTDAQEACSRHVRLSEKRYAPSPERMEAYRQGYEIYRQLYPQLSHLMHLNAMRT